MLHSFTAFRVHSNDQRTVGRFEQLSIEDLDAGSVVIRTAFSSINYKDAMAAKGIGKNVRTDRPCVTGIDLSGTVSSSKDPRFKEGDEVIVTNFALGVDHDGGYAEYARVPADWIVPLPRGLSLFEAMALGTAGLTAALAVDRLERAGVTPEAGPIAVTGATGGVGSLAIGMFSAKSYEVVAVTGKAGQECFLRNLGADRILTRADLVGEDGVLGSPRWAGALDSVGGSVLDRIASQMKEHGKLAVCGMAAGADLKTTVYPFILRSVDVLGINVSRTLRMDDRRRLWERLAGDLKPASLGVAARCIPFVALSEHFDEFIASTVTGRLVVEVGGARGASH